jgi:hypothetical protein
MRAIEAKPVTSVTRTPFAASESTSCSTCAGSGSRDASETSPPSSARACSRTDAVMFAAKESMATNAAAPSEIDDM